MSRIAQVLERVRGEGRKALIPYIAAGDPYADATADVMQGLVEGGADVIELGVPFSDPMADGPVVQKASERALARGIGLPQVLDIVRGFRQRDTRTPIVLMGYANPIERFDQRLGAGAFVREAAQAGVDGVLVVDYPPEECAEFAAALKSAGIDLIFLLAPTSTDARIREVARLASGYVYYVSLKGVTGAGHLDVSAVAQAMPRIRAHVKVPVGVGFGIRDAASARAVAKVADAVVIGSRLVQILEAEPRDNVAAAGRRFMAEIRTALDTSDQGNVS
ncbi:MAG TPA: tryptophan synthase subunit alpha [Burkholderiaceae bacterium]|nr:tryptophan synthase subunit alpha [Burkholderiaceae bacterium]